MNKNQKLIITGLATIFIVLIIVIGCVASKQSEPEVSDFVAPTFEQTAVVGTPIEVDSSLNYQTFSVEDKMVIGMCGNLTLEEDNTVDIYFTSDATNPFWAKVRLLDEDGNILGESGLIRAGEYVPSVTLTNPPRKSAMVIAKILTYEEETYYSKGSVTAQVMLNVE